MRDGPLEVAGLVAGKQTNNEANEMHSFPVVSTISHAHTQTLPKYSFAKRRAD